MKYLSRVTFVVAVAWLYAALLVFSSTALASPEASAHHSVKAPTGSEEAHVSLALVDAEVCESESEDSDESDSVESGELILARDAGPARVLRRVARPHLLSSDLRRGRVRGSPAKPPPLF